MQLIILSGVIRDLVIARGYEELAFTAGNRSLVGLAAIVAASTGNNTNATILSNSSSGAEVDMEYFTCFVGETPLKGRFHKVDFQNGDLIEFVVSMERGVAEVHGARDPSHQFIWTLPYQTRGHIAQKRSDILSSIIVSSICACIAVIIAIYQERSSLPGSRPVVLEFATMAFFIVLIVNFLSRWPFFKYSFEATEVFRAFGYEDPARVDLPKQDGRADKAYCSEKGEPRPLVKPWRYRYEPVNAGVVADNKIDEQQIEQSQ